MCKAYYEEDKLTNPYYNSDQHRKLRIILGISEGTSFFDEDKARWLRYLLKVAPLYEQEKIEIDRLYTFVRTRLKRLR